MMISILSMMSQFKASAFDVPASQNLSETSSTQLYYAFNGDKLETMKHPIFKGSDDVSLYFIHIDEDIKQKICFSAFCKSDLTNLEEFKQTSYRFPKYKISLIKDQIGNYGIVVLNELNTILEDLENNADEFNKWFSDIDNSRTNPFDDNSSLLDKLKNAFDYLAKVGILPNIENKYPTLIEKLSLLKENLSSPKFFPGYKIRKIKDLIGNLFDRLYISSLDLEFEDQDKYDFLFLSPNYLTDTKRYTHLQRSGYEQIGYYIVYFLK